MPPSPSLSRYTLWPSAKEQCQSHNYITTGHWPTAIKFMSLVTY